MRSINEFNSGLPLVIEASDALYHLLSTVDSFLYSHLVNRDGLRTGPGNVRQGTYPSVPCFLTTNSPLMGRGTLGHGESMPVPIPINELGFEPQYFALHWLRVYLVITLHLKTIWQSWMSFCTKQW